MGIFERYLSEELGDEAKSCAKNLESLDIPEWKVNSVAFSVSLHFILQSADK